MAENQTKGSSSSSTSIPHDHLKKSLSPFDGICVILSIMIGSGIFASPGIVLQRAGSPGAAILAWLCSGLLVISASFCYSELGTMFPTGK